MTLHSVVFRLSCRQVPGAAQVAVAASFNNWDVRMHLLQKNAAGDYWTISVFLPRGVYAYLFDVDGGWHNDPEDDGRMPTGWGNDYSLKTVQ